MSRIYSSAAVEQAWRLVALLDRNPHSGTRGSFSRTHWAWKFSDFPYPRMQEGVYALVRLHDLDVPGNPLYQSAAARSWVEWALEYWVALQHPDGAYDEAYPNERCLAATAFTGFYVGSALERWRDRLDPALRARVEAALVKANDWLCHNDETHGLLSNHLGVAVASLELAGRTFGQARFTERARVFLDRILAHQSAEGWFPEYDGADPGYGGHAVFYLACYWKATGCDRTREALVRCADFLSYCVHPDGTIGGEYGSRNTEFYYPAGFEMLAAVSPASAAIAVTLRQAIADRRVCGVWSMDEFNLMPMLNNLLFAVDAAVPVATTAPLPFQQPPFRRYFSDAGFWIVNEPNYYAIVGASKGGTASLFDKTKGTLAARTSGLVVESGNRRYTSQDFVRAPAVTVDAGGQVLTTTVTWKSLTTLTFGPLLFLGFRVFTLTLGRWPVVSRWVKQLLVRTLIRRKQRPSVSHRREVQADATGLHITDHLECPWDTGRLMAVTQFTAVHMGSSLYADARTASAAAPVVELPLRRRLVVRGSLTLNGASWRVE